MILKTAVQFSHYLIEQVVQDGAVVVDATAGNGHDTSFLAERVGPNGHVYAFDIQEEAVIATRDRLKEKNLIDRATVIQDSHHLVSQYLKETTIHLGLFNLGYLPGGDKSIVTQFETTRLAAEELLERLIPNGLVILVVYPGHEEGQLESQEIVQWSKSLDQNKFTVQKIGIINQINRPPYVLAIEKKGLRSK